MAEAGELPKKPLGNKHPRQPLQPLPEYRRYTVMGHQTAAERERAAAQMHQPRNEPGDTSLSARKAEVATKHQNGIDQELHDMIDQAKEEK